MPNPKVNEADYYESVGEWLVKRGLGERWASNVAKSTLWSVDVLGGGKDGATVACELKCLAYPNGAAGAGAIGQALALKVFVPDVYVALVVGNSLGFKDCSWSNPKKNQRGMADLLGLTGRVPTDFSTYCNCVSDLFSAQFGETGLGLLVVNADDRKTVEHVLKPTTRRPAFAQPAQWLEALRKDEARERAVNRRAG